MNHSKLREDIEDWLDNDSHSGRLPAKIMFSDIELIAELLLPRFIFHISTIYKDIETAVEGLKETPSIFNGSDVYLTDEQENKNSTLKDILTRIKELKGDKE